MVRSGGKGDEEEVLALGVVYDRVCAVGQTARRSESGGGQEGSCADVPSDEIISEGGATGGPFEGGRADISGTAGMDGAVKNCTP